MKIPVEGNPNLFRDINSGAIINGSDIEFQKYLEIKELKIKEIREMNELKSQVSEIDQLKNDVNEIKNMMQIILSKLQSNS